MSWDSQAREMLRGNWAIPIQTLCNLFKSSLSAAGLDSVPQRTEQWFKLCDQIFETVTHPVSYPHFCSRILLHEPKGTVGMAALRRVLAEACDQGDTFDEILSFLSKEEEELKCASIEMSDVDAADLARAEGFSRTSFITHATCEGPTKSLMAI